MKRTATSQRRRSKALTDPQPEFVSLVRTGANMTPFRVVRAEDVEGETEAEAAVVEEIEADPATSVKAADHEVLMIVFDKEVYGDEATVKAWLDDGGYEDYTITAKDDTFQVGEIEEGRATRTIAIKGITVHVAHKLDVEEVDRAEGAAGVITGVKPVAKKSEQVVVPEERRKALYQISELASVVSFVGWLVNDMEFDVVYGEEDEEPGKLAALTHVKAAGQSLLDALSTLVGVEVTEMANAFKTAEEERLEAARKAEAPAADVTEETTTVADEAAVEKTEEVEAEAETAEVEKTEEAEVTATEETEVEKTEVVEETTETVETDAAKEELSEDDTKTVVKSLFDAVKELTATVEALKTATVTAKSDEELADRVTAIENNERQTRKGADVDEVTTEISAEDRTRAAMAEQRTRSILGIRRR